VAVRMMVFPTAFFARCSTNVDSSGCVTWSIFGIWEGASGKETLTTTCTDDFGNIQSMDVTTRNCSGGGWFLELIQLNNSSVYLDIIITLRCTELI
jgi:hypothetical protein